MINSKETLTETHSKYGVADHRLLTYRNTHLDSVNENTDFTLIDQSHIKTANWLREVMKCEVRLYLGNTSRNP